MTKRLTDPTIIATMASQSEQSRYSELIDAGCVLVWRTYSQYGSTLEVKTSEGETHRFSGTDIEDCYDQACKQLARKPEIPADTP